MRVTIRLDDGPPITVLVDHVTLIDDRSALTFAPRLQLKLEFPLTQEFTDWWTAQVYAHAGPLTPDGQDTAVPRHVKVEFPSDWTAAQEAQWRAEFEEWAEGR